MKKIINTNQNKLIFPKIDFSIESNEIKKVTDTQYFYLMQNSWIHEIFPEKKEVFFEKQLENKKGRKIKKRKVK